MLIRKLKKDDFDQYKVLRKEGLDAYQAYTEEKLKTSFKQIKNEFDDIFLDKTRIVFIIKENNEIKAYIIGTLINNAFACLTYIDDIFVRKDMRKKGLGKLLVNEFKKWSESKKAKRIRLGVRINNKNAINFYKNIGFEIMHYEMEIVI